MTRKWRQMAEIYKRFAGEGWDFSDQAAEEMFLFESKGVRFDNPNNGYLVGKQWMDLTITEYWLPDLEEGKILFAWELYEDFPKWFLDRVLPKKYHERSL